MAVQCPCTMYNGLKSVTVTHMRPNPRPARRLYVVRILARSLAKLGKVTFNPFPRWSATLL